jgi:hypothetical protein
VTRAAYSFLLHEPAAAGGSCSGLLSVGNVGPGYYSRCTKLSPDNVLAEPISLPIMIPP